MSAEYEFDLFISHASEDKDGFVRELVQRLEERGLRVWFDDAELQVGDRLTPKIDEGLARSRFGVVVLSPAFFQGGWPEAELDALTNRENAEGQVVVLPIWLGISAEEVMKYSPLLKGKKALRSEDGLDSIVEQLVRRVRGRTSAAPAAASRSVSSSVTLEPAVLRGHVLPQSYSPIVASDDHVLVVRAAVALRAPTSPEPRIRSATKTAFQEALATSSIEAFLRELSWPAWRSFGDGRWQPGEPTRSWVVTQSRESAKMAVDGWMEEARSGISLRPAMSVGPAGWMIVHLDVVVRPVVAEPSPTEYMPLSLDDLFALLYVPVTALVEDIIPATVPGITGGEPEILAVSTLLLPHGDPFSRYFRLNSYASVRVPGATDPHAAVWEPSEIDEVMNSEKRTTAVRDQIEGLFLDGGYDGFEDALERLTPPALPPITRA